MCLKPQVHQHVHADSCHFFICQPFTLLHLQYINKYIILIFLYSFSSLFVSFLTYHFTGSPEKWKDIAARNKLGKALQLKQKGRIADWWVNISYNQSDSSFCNTPIIQLWKQNICYVVIIYSIIIYFASILLALLAVLHTYGTFLAFSIIADKLRGKD